MRLPPSTVVLTPILSFLLAAPASALVRFVNVASETGTTNVSYGRGAAWVDLDQDGLLDLVNANSGMRNEVFRQLPDHTFVSMNAAWGIPDDDKRSWGVLAADFDNDGDRDLFFFNGGYRGAEGSTLLRNDLSTKGVFTDLSQRGDLTYTDYTFGGTASDFDRDGDLDIFLANVGETCALLRNEGNLYFTRHTTDAGLVEVGDYKHCSAGDVDNDGWIDVAVGNFSGHNRLYRNNGDGTFTDIALQTGVFAPHRNFGMTLEDFNNDGWLDILIPKWQTQPDATTQLFFNQANGTFKNITSQTELTSQTDMGHNTGDIDDDGFPDILIGTGHPDFQDYDRVFRVTMGEDQRARVVDVTEQIGWLGAGRSRSHGMVFGDYDNDGDLDIYSNNGGPEWVAKSIEPNFLWQSQGTGNHWFGLDLSGVRSNRDAVGAIVQTVTASQRPIYRYLRVGKGFGNTDSHIVHVGLGRETEVDHVRIQWPNGAVQYLLSPAPGRVHAVVETELALDGGQPRIGGQALFRISGPEGHRVDLLMSETRIEPQRDEHFGGFLELGSPYRLAGRTTLGADRSGQISVAIPDRPPLVGRRYYLQAWVRDPDVTDGGTLSNVEEMTIQP